jgi:2-oxoglutarate dehydrogenase E1 component
MLKGELQKARSGFEPKATDAYEEGDWKGFRAGFSHDPVATAVAGDVLDSIAGALTTIPEGFTLHPKLQRFVAQRAEAYLSGEGVDWAFAESLAFGSLLVEGYHVRLSGEDSGRGTFSQRHAVWWDVSASAPRAYVALNHIRENQSPFSVYDSPLSEFSILGFEYGYSLAQPKVLVLWEAQFGDFANGAQVVIDQFVAAGESKWQRASGLVLLLPHGYEGQGPEHSSAHLERYLQLCAEDNIQVVYPTTPAQYFHVLRRQMKRNFRKPLVVMTPKSLLRHKMAVSRVDEMTSGRFLEVIDDPEPPKNVESVLLCSGKVYYDLLQRRTDGENTRTAIVRIEQLYPFPQAQLDGVLANYSGVTDFRWVQEEPRNRGAWSFVHNRLLDLEAVGSVQYVGRAASASPAAGSYAQHVAELEELLNEAFSLERNRANFLARGA